MRKILLLCFIASCFLSSCDFSSSETEYSNEAINNLKNLKGFRQYMLGTNISNYTELVKMPERIRYIGKHRLNEGFPTDRYYNPNEDLTIGDIKIDSVIYTVDRGLGLLSSVKIYTNKYWGNILSYTYQINFAPVDSTYLENNSRYKVVNDTIYQIKCNPLYYENEILSLSDYEDYFEYESKIIMDERLKLWKKRDMEWKAKDEELAREQEKLNEERIKDL